MALIAREGGAPTLYELLQGALKYTAYTQKSNGTVGGLYYQPFTKLTADTYDLRGRGQRRAPILSSGHRRDGRRWCAYELQRGSFGWNEPG